MSRQPIRLVCFDLGGVIIRICRSWEEGCAEAGIEVRQPQERARSAEARHELVVRFQIGRIDGQTFAEGISAVLERAYSPQEILAVHHAWMIDEYEGVREIVAELRNAGIPTAALSNTNHEHWARIVDFPTVLQLDHLFASHLLGLHKPDPAIYYAVERQLGVSGGEILFFDDLPENVDGARAVGWCAEVIDPLACTATQIRHRLAEHGTPL